MFFFSHLPSFPLLPILFQSPLVFFIIPLKGAKETISLAQAKDIVPGLNCILKSLWG